MADAPKILGTDTLRDAYPKLNSAIDNSNEAKTKADTAIETANTAKTTADTVQSQFDQVVAEAGENNPEVVQARGEAVNLNARLDATDAQLADFEQQVSSIGELKVNGVYATISDLQTALPTGNNGVFIVVADGNWYYWDTTQWVSGGVFQSIQWFNATTTQDEPWEVV
jgi:hypothetical protein